MKLKKIIAIFDNPLLIIIIIFFCISILGLPLLWSSKRFKTSYKIIISILAIVEFIGFYFLFQGIFKEIVEKSADSINVVEVF